MTVGRRAHVGWEVRCDATGCAASTAAQVSSAAWRRNLGRAVEAARRLGWLSVTISQHDYWVCPLHQTWDPRLDRWVATPRSIIEPPRRTA